MPRSLALVALLVAAAPLLALASPGGAAVDAASIRSAIAQVATPAPVLPGEVALIEDEPDRPGLPFHFRMMSDPFPTTAEGPLPSRAGLDTLRASGSGQFSSQQLAAVVARVGQPLVVIDLRQESHGLVDGRPVSWYAMHDQVNVVRSLIEVQQDERRRLNALAALGEATLLVHLQKSAPGTISGGQPITVPVGTALAEQQVAQELGLGYFRIPATDFLAPTAENVDRIVAFAAGLPPETWLHFHCHGGDGRTTTFLAIWDMMHNAATVSVEDIVRRQALLGPVDLFRSGTPESWTYPAQRERAAFVRRFHQYAAENAASGFIVPWSVWSATHPPRS